MGEESGNGARASATVDLEPRYGLPHINEMLLLERMRGAGAGEWGVFMFVSSRCHWTTGRGGHPGLEATSSAVGVDRRNVQRALCSLQERKVLVLAKRGGGRGWAATFDVHPDLMAKKKGGPHATLAHHETAVDTPPFLTQKGGVQNGKGGENGRKGGATTAPSLPTSLPTSLPEERPSLRDGTKTFRTVPFVPSTTVCRNCNGDPRGLFAGRTEDGQERYTPCSVCSRRIEREPAKSEGK